MARWGAAVAAVVLLLDACVPSSAPGAGPDAPETIAPDAPVPADAPADTLDASPEADADRWVLPPCYRACDRVVSCGLASCEAYGWASAGALFESCFGACDEGRAEQVLATGTCEDALDVARAWTEALAGDACAATPCSLACGQLGECLVSECPGYSGQDPAAIAASCEGGCNPDDVAWVFSSIDCASLVGMIEQSDPVFAANCRATPGVCPDAAACATYGSKSAACLSLHCGEPAAPFLDGVAEVIAQFCRTDKGCPSPEAVAVLNGPGQTCDSPAFAGLGDAPPFLRVCNGSPDVPLADLDAACARLFGCGAGQYLSSTQACVVFLTFISDAPLRAACLTAAPGCGEVWACLEGV